jgi:hypothetical protein
MTGYDLRELQELMMRAYVRHLMFLATLPYHLVREMGRARSAAGDRRTGAAAPILLSDWRARPRASNE